MKVFDTLDVSNQRITSLASPSAGTDATNKNYVDDRLNGNAWKAPVRVATTTNGNLTTAFVVGQVIDGVTLALNDRILVKNQTNGAENGIRLVAASGAPPRAADMDISAEAINNATVKVQDGTVNKNKSFTLTTSGVITLDTTALTFVEVGSGGNTYLAGNGLTESPAGTFNVGAGTGIIVNADDVAIDPSVAVRKYSANIGNGSLTTIAVTHNLNTRDITWSLRDVTTHEFYLTTGVATDVNTLTLTFGSAPAANSLRVVVHG